MNLKKKEKYTKYEKEKQLKHAVTPSGKSGDPGCQIFWLYSCQGRSLHSF